MTSRNLNNESKKSNRGGSRPGAGRKPGSRSKRLSWRDVIDSFEARFDQPFSQVLVDNYWQARLRGDWSLVCQYDRAIFNKLAPDLHHVEITQDPTLEELSRDFDLALQAISQRKTA